MTNEPTLMSMWLGQHTKRPRIITCGFVSTTHNPLRAAESIAALDHMLGGRFGVGIVRGYQARWVANFRIRPDLEAVGSWNKDSAEPHLLIGDMPAGQRIGPLEGEADPLPAAVTAK